MKYRLGKLQAFSKWVVMFFIIFFIVLFGGYFMSVMLSSATPEDSVARDVVKDFEYSELKEGTYYVYGGAHGLPMNKAASEFSKIVTVIPNKSAVEILSKSTRGFYKIKYNDRIGYVQGDYLLTLDEKPSKKLKKKLRTDYPLYTVENCVEYVSLFSKKDTSSKVKMKVYYGERVRVLGNASDGYYRVAYRNKVGYILEDYLVKTE